MTGLSGRHVAITGGAGGIGCAIARRMLAEGADVTLIDIDRARLDEVVAELGSATRGLVSDVSDPDACTAVVAEATRRAGRPVDILVNNAGVILRGVPVASIAPQSWDWIMGVNFYGAVNMVRAALPAMQVAGSGHIVTIGSISGFVVGTRQSGAYAASKFALTAYVEALAADLNGSGIGVSLIVPAGVSTRLYDNSAASRTGPDVPGAIDATPPDTAAAMSPDIIAGRVMEAIATRRLHLMTHPETRDWIEDRHSRVIGGFLDAAAVAR